LILLAREPQAVLFNEDLKKGDALPAGWTEHLDEKTGLPYYYAASTASTVWQRPTEPAPPASRFGCSRRMYVCLYECLYVCLCDYMYSPTAPPPHSKDPPRPPSAEIGKSCLGTRTVNYFLTPYPVSLPPCRPLRVHFSLAHFCRQQDRRHPASSSADQRCGPRLVVRHEGPGAAHALCCC
jgi:hypothetical protein